MAYGTVLTALFMVGGIALAMYTYFAAPRLYEQSSYGGHQHRRSIEPPPPSNRTSAGGRPTIRKRSKSKRPIPDKELCAICYEPAVAANNNVTVLHCTHIFHSTCINQWFKCENGICPICRSYTSLNTH